MCKNPEDVQKTIYFPPEVDKKLEDRRKIMKRSYSAEVVHIVEHHLKRVEREEQKSLDSLPNPMKDAPINV